MIINHFNIGYFLFHGNKSSLEIFNKIHKKKGQIFHKIDFSLTYLGFLKKKKNSTKEVIVVAILFGNAIVVLPFDPVTL